MSMPIRFAKRALISLMGLLLSLPAVAAPADPAACRQVRFADVGWADVTATTAVASQVLGGLGYDPKITVLSVPVTFNAMRNRDIDVFLGNWMPMQDADRKP